MGTQEVRAFMQEMDAFVRDRLGGRLRVEYTGQMAWLTAVADYVGSGQAASLASAVITIGLMMILCLRSVVLGCISMLPNIVPILMPMGLMGLAGIDLSLVLMIFSSVIIGVCVDDTTHFYVTFQRMFARKGTYRESLLATVRTVGQPVTFTTISLMLGPRGNSASLGRRPFSGAASPTSPFPRPCSPSSSPWARNTSRRSVPEHHHHPERRTP